MSAKGLDVFCLRAHPDTRGGRTMTKAARKKPGKPSVGSVPAVRSPSVTPMDAEVEPLFERVVSILERARGEVVRSVNTQTVVAYWLIGREIVEAVQAGRAHAKYGERVLEELSRLLAGRFGKGFAPQTLRSFRQFFVTYIDRRPEMGSAAASDSGDAKRFPPGSEFDGARRSTPESASRDAKRFPRGSELVTPATPTFHPMLSWSHYRALMRVERPEARAFYEEEAVASGWSKSTSNDRSRRCTTTGC